MIANKPYRPRVILDNNPKSTKKHDSIDQNQIDEGIGSSISNASEYNNSNISSSFLNLKNKDLKQPGAYIISQRIKNDCSLIKVIDLSDNSLQDEGIMHLAFSLKLCKFLTNLTLSNNLITDYGLRILLENLNTNSLISLNISDNNIGLKGCEHLSSFLNGSKLQQLSINNTNIGEVGAKFLGVALGSNNTLKSLEASSNNIKLAGAAAIGRGLMANSSVENLNLSCNSFSIEGATALAECLKVNKSIKTLNVHTNNLAYDSVKCISGALKQNASLKYLNLSYNNIGQGIYDLLSAINNDTSALEYLCIKNIPMPKHLVLIIELIQQRRKFQCEYSSVMFHADSVRNKRDFEEESMIKLARYLGEKRMRLVDMFKVLDKGNTQQMTKDEFSRRMKLFEPRLTNKDIQIISKSFTDKDVIDYSSLYEQAVNKPDNKLQINRLKNQLNESDEIYLKKTTKEYEKRNANAPLKTKDKGGSGTKTDTDYGGSNYAKSVDMDLFQETESNLMETQTSRSFERSNKAKSKSMPDDLKQNSRNSRSLSNNKTKNLSKTDKSKSPVKNNQARGNWRDDEPVVPRTYRKADQIGPYEYDLENYNHDHTGMYPNRLDNNHFSDVGFYGNY